MVRREEQTCLTTTREQTTAEAIHVITTVIHGTITITQTVTPTAAVAIATVSQAIQHQRGVTRRLRAAVIHLHVAAAAAEVQLLQDRQDKQPSLQNSDQPVF